MTARKVNDRALDNIVQDRPVRPAICLRSGAGAYVKATRG
jgi:hypothetical protein